jgi:hypothetical protein
VGLPVIRTYSRPVAGSTLGAKAASGQPKQRFHTSVSKQLTEIAGAANRVNRIIAR